MDRGGGTSDKGAGIQMAIQQNKHESERVQKKTFTNWMNTYLCQKTPSVKVENLCEDIKDGSILIYLLEVLSGDTLPIEKRQKMQRVHYLSNISTALKFLESKKIKLVNINPTDIVDGKPSIVLGLVWTIILYFQIEETMSMAAQVGALSEDGGPPKKLSALEKFRSGARKALLNWAGNAITKADPEDKYGIPVKDFGKCWRSGEAFNAIIHTIRPDLVDMEKVQRQSPRVNLEHAFSTAETELGIPRLLDPEDVDVDKPDEKSVMTYVAQFLKAYPDMGEESATKRASRSSNPGEAEMQDYNDLLVWIKNEATEVLQIVDQPVGDDINQEFMDYLAFKVEVDKKEVIYKRLEEKILTNKAVKLTPSLWKPLEEKWGDVYEKTRLWLLKLDTSQPGEVGELGRWLYEAETLLSKEVDMSDNPEEVADSINFNLNEHKRFFKDLDAKKKFFADVKRSGTYRGKQLPAKILEHMSQRLQSTSTEAPKKEKKMEFEELKFRLLASLLATDEKVKLWTAKFGHEEDVNYLVDDYNDFTKRRKALELFDKMYSEAKEKADIYKKDGTKDKAEKEHITKFLSDVNDRWKDLSKEIKGISPKLEKVLHNWSVYNGCVKFLTDWYEDGERALLGSTDVKQAFFQTLPEAEKQFKDVNEAADYLISVSTDPVGATLRQTVEALSQKLNVTGDELQTFQQVEVIGKAKQEYSVGVDHLKKWLDEGDDLINSSIPCVHATLKEYLQQLDVMNSQVPEVESDFKTTTKTAQSLVKESSQDVVNDMLQTLNVQKESLVAVRKGLPEKLKHVKALLPNVESVETGITDLHMWLDEGEKMLASHKLDGNPDDTENRLQNHKTFFSETTYQKSILESKNKVYQKVVSSKPKLKNVDFTDIDNVMSGINERFQNCITSAKDWEKKLENLSKLWRVLQQKQQQLEDWLEQAHNVLDDTEDDLESLIRKHKKYFDRVDEKYIKDFTKACDDVISVIDENDREEVEKLKIGLQDVWKNITYQAPIRLMHLEFQVPEETFVQQVENAEKTAVQHQQQLSSGENIKEALQKHKKLFQESQLIPTCNKCLSSMEKSAKKLKEYNDDSGLQERFEDHQDRWKKLCTVSDDIHVQLKQLPERWKEYDKKVNEMTNWMDDVEALVKAMQDESITAEEYKDMMAKLQAAMRHKGKFSDDAKVLAKQLDELLKDAPEADGDSQRQRLGDLMKRFSALQPTMEKTSDKSTVFSKSYEFRDNVSKKHSWLEETQKLVMEQPFVDGLEDARGYLQEHESLMKRLDSERSNIQAEIEAGRRLQKDRNAPTFVSKTIDELDRTWKDTNELAKAKHLKLKQMAKDWEKYEGDKGSLLQLLKKAEAELEKPTITSGQDLAQKDFQTKKEELYKPLNELQGTLNKLKGSLTDISRINAVLCETASVERQGPLKVEVTEIDKKLDSVSGRLNAKLADLESTIAKWSEYYKRLNNFCDWLNEKEVKLTAVFENKREEPEKQLQQANTISSEVYENHITLENLEKDGKGMSQNFRSRETAALKSKLTTVRRQWENLCSKAKDRSSALTGSVAHWQKYQTLSQQLTPWLAKAEKYCATDLPKCSSQEEAQDLHSLHQAFLKECEENVPVFDKLCTEAGYLMDQPNTSREIESVQKKWNNIIKKSEERSHKVEKMKGAWGAYENELQGFQETMNKFQKRLDNEPNYNTGDVQVLEHELALSKALQEDMRSHLPHLNAMQRQFEQVMKHASPEGMDSLKSKQESVKSAWNDLLASGLERQNTLNNATKHRKDFFARLNDFEKWQNKMQRKLDTGGEIYSDEVPEMMAKLKEMKAEFRRQDPAFNSLTQEFKELIGSCNEDEAGVLSDRLNRLMQGYTKMEDLVASREKLGEKWTKYSKDHKDTQSKLKALQAKLNSPDIKEEEVARIYREIENLKSGMKDWKSHSDELDDLMIEGHMSIKDRATQRTLHFGTELQNLDSIFDNLAYTAKQKEEHLGEVSQLCNDFIDKKDDLVDNLKRISQRLENISVDSSDIQGIQNLLREIEDIRDDVYANNPEYEQLRELGRQIQQADSNKGSSVQGQLSGVNEAWETVQALLAEKHQYYGAVSNLWQQYNDTKQGVTKTLDGVEPVLQQDIIFSNPADVKKSLDQHKNAEFELHANQSQLDLMNNKGLQLLEELRSIPNFKMSVLEQDLDDVNHSWETANETVEQQKANLEAQLICWDQVQTGNEEVGAWVNTMVKKLDDSLKNFDDAVTVESRLVKYKEESPYFSEVLQEVSQKMRDLQDLNKDKDIPALRQVQDEIEEKFEKATVLANKLENVMSSYSGEQKDLQQEIEEETEILNRLKEKLSKCDDTSGSDEDLVERLDIAKEICEELETHKDKIAAIQKKTSALQSKYPSAETASLAKDAVVLGKKYEALVNRGDKVAEMLVGSLENQVQEAVIQQERWVNTASERVNWCDDFGGDRYSAEAKLATVKDLMASLGEGEVKKTAASSKFDLLKKILPKGKQSELDQKKKFGEDKWLGLVSKMQETANKLEGSLNQWQAHDGRYQELNQWLKDAENKLRNESMTKPDLSSKMDQSETFKKLEAEVLKRRNEFEKLNQDAQDITRSTGDGRTASSTAQLLNRFHTVSAAVQDQVERCDQNIEDHKNYSDKIGDSTEWLKSAQMLLDDCSTTAGDQDSLQKKLDTVQALLASKDEGLQKFNAALESGERLLPNTSNEGREQVRKDLRQLRDMWENFNDSLNVTQRQLENNQMQWSTFDENSDQLLKWITDMEHQMKTDSEFKNSLQEKKAMLQHYRTRCQDIMSHQSMIDSVSDKGSAIPSSQIKTKLKDLNTRYAALCSTAQSNVKMSQEYVDQHQQYQDQFQACCDWLASCKDRLAVCAEPGGDKQAMQTRVDRAQDLLVMIKDGETKIKSVKLDGEKTIPQTAAQGQAIIRGELDRLVQEWQSLSVKTDDAKQNLSHALGNLQSYDVSCETLNKWIRDMEAQIKDYELKSTMKEKENQIGKFKTLEQNINSKETEFDELHKMVAQIPTSDTRMLNFSNQLGGRYQSLKNNIKDVINRWQDFAQEHKAYQTDYAQSLEWVDTLKKRLEVCADMRGDKADVEDRLAKLQELLVEKDEGSEKIHHTISQGEQLYPNTASEGRDLIRHELRTLREQWESACDQLTDTQRNLESCLLQWSSYDENYEQFHKWLLDAEVKLKEDADMKAILPDKKAQLQNHKVLHQDIYSRQHVIDNLSDKAQALTHATPSAKVNKFVGELDQKYERLRGTSEQMLNTYDIAVKDHQQYQDTYQDCLDWLNSSREKVEACSDTSGDRISLQNKLERLKDFGSKLGDGEKKLKLTKELAEKTAKNTSPQGQDSLSREMDLITSEWDDHVNRIKQAESNIQQAKMQWGDFESKFETCAAWLKDMEQQVKNYELKSTLQEKQEQVEKFKKQREEVLTHQPDFDKFTDDAQNLMHTSSDVRLSTQVSQLTNRYQGLLSLLKDLINKWERYSQEHQTYESRLAEYNEWIVQADSKLQTCQQPTTDQDSMEERKVMIQMLFSEKDHGLQKLNSTLETGERLYPDTASAGREKVRQELRIAKDDWDKLYGNLNDSQRKVDSFLMQWTSYADGQDQLLRWLTDTENTLRADVDLKNTLQEKRLQLQNHRTLSQDIKSHQRLVDSNIEKAQGVLQTTSNPDVSTFITNISTRYENVASTAKTSIQKSEQCVQDHQQYQDAMQVAVDWLTLMKDRLSMCSDTTGDRHTIQNKLDRLNELLAILPEGDGKFQDCQKVATSCMDTTALKGRQAIKQELDVMKLDWEDFNLKVNSLKGNLEQALIHWTQYEDQYDKLCLWIKEMEKRVKEFPLKSTIEEKQEQFRRYQELMQEIKSHQREVDKFSDEAQALQQLTGETRVNTFISQLTTRYQSLQVALKDILKKCEQNVDEHKHYREKYNDCANWLNKAKEKFSDCSDTSGTRQDLEKRLDKVQDLVNHRDTGIMKLNQAVESGEKLYPNTAGEGREVIRQELRQLKITWESLFDDLSATQRKLEVSLVQWTSFDDSYGQVENWLREMEMQLEGQIPLRSTLEEKKVQLQNYKVINQDVLSYQRVIDSVSDKAQSLVHSSSDPELSKFVSKTGARYQKLNVAAKERVHQYDGFVASHQQYNDAYNSFVEWLNGVRERLSMCADISGDRHAIQGRLDKIQDIMNTKLEGEPKVKNVIALAEKTLPNTAPQGKELIVRETEALKNDWGAFVSALGKTKSELENCMDQWKEFEILHEKCSNWLKDIDNKLKDTELKSTLKDKQAQLDKLKALFNDIESHQEEIENLTDAAQDLSRMSNDTRVSSQASQMTTKHQTLLLNVRELCRRWEQYVIDHQAYIGSFDQCSMWLKEMQGKIASLNNTSGDRKTIQDRISHLQDQISDKEEGLHMLQIALDNLQVVLPNTSVMGRDNMRREMQQLQQEYDTLSGSLNEIKSKLDGCLTQWNVYDDSVEQSKRWLMDLEDQIKTESELQNTLQEKKLQQERIKVLQLNIGSQQSTIDNLNEKAESLKQTTKDTTLSDQIKEVVTNYEKLGSEAKNLFGNREKYLRDHQTYRDSYMETTEWLSSAMDQLNTCSDVRGDRHTIEVQRNKLQSVLNITDTGRQKVEATINKAELVLPQTSGQGQALIKEELTMLTNDFETFEADVKELKNTLESLQGKWQEYEQQYNELSQWIKDTEAEVKADSELKATLEEKTVQLERQRDRHDEILQQQTVFDSLAEKAQILLQSNADHKITSQLTQMSSRYSGLISMSKDLLKRYEQHVQDHDQYKEAYGDAVSWVKSTLDKVSVCSDISGDRYVIQSQLEKLQEFLVTKEEGQLLINTSNTWGEKTMKNTSMDGREIIRKELQQLQLDWEAMITEVSDTKVNLESCLLQWTNYNESSNQIQKWLKDMERKVRDSEPKSDLSEKRAELHRIKNLYQDIVAYEQMIESVGTKATGLTQKSPVSKANIDTTQLVNRYQTLKQSGTDLMAKCEQNVAQHHAYQDSCNSFMSWLKTAREKLATCSDTFGEKSSISDKIERTKGLLASLSEGSQRLSQATKAGENTLPNTSPQGQTKIRQELQSMNQDFEDYRSNLVQSQSDLEICLDRWSEFEESYQQFNNWLKESENHLRSELEMKPTAEEKKQQCAQAKAYFEELTAHQTYLDKVNEKAQALLQTNADAKTSQAITQLTTRFQGVIALAKDINKSLEAYYDNHSRYKGSLREFDEWLRDTKVKLKTVIDASGAKEDVSTKLNKIVNLQAAMDAGSGRLRSLLDSSEKTLPNTSTKGCQVIRQETEQAKTEYENLLTDVSQAKRNLETALGQWSDFDRMYEQTYSWLTDVENKYRSAPDQKADLPEKKSNLEKFKALQNDVHHHTEIIEKLSEKSSHLQDAKPKSLVSDLKTRFKTLEDNSKDVLNQLTDQVQGHEEYRKSHIGSLDWMANMKYRLQQLTNYSGDRKTLQDRLDQLKDFQDEMDQGQEMINKTIELGNGVMRSTAPRGQDAIQRELQTLREDWVVFRDSANDVEVNLESCISNWHEMDEDINAFIKWMEATQKKIKGCVNPKSDLPNKTQQLREGEGLYDEIVENRVVLEKIREKGDAVSHRNSDPRLANSLMQLTTKYQHLATSGKNLVQRLTDNTREHKSYNEAFDTASKWLSATMAKIQYANDTSGDWHTVQDNIETIKNITKNMDEGLQKVNRVCDLAEKILPATSADGKKLIEQQVTDLTNQWEELNHQISECSNLLEGVQDRWHDYEEYYGTFIKWLADTESALANEPEPKSQVVEKKTQLDKYRLMLSDIENHQRLINELAERVANLEALSDNPEVSGSLRDIQTRYDKIRHRARDIVQNLEKAHDEHLDFHESQQESEKWLLQTSFKLMNHNSLNVSSLELTQRQIDKHLDLLREIEDYRTTLDRVNQKGRKLIEKNPRVPRLAQTVQSQLQNLEESYLNLQSTAEQIRNRLTETLQKWEDYKDLLEKTEDFIADDFQEWLFDADSSVPDSLQEAQRKLDASKTMWEKLTGFRQDLSSSAHRCENLGSMDNLDQADETIESPVCLLADRVNGNLQSSLKEVEERMDKMRDAIHQWESIERTKSDLRNWLQTKQEDVQELEQKPAKLHEEAAEYEISQLKTLRDEVKGKEEDIDALLVEYQELTHHDPTLSEPSIRAVQEDWDELIGMIDNLIDEREMAMESSRELREQQDEMSSALEDYAKELDLIERQEATTVDKAQALQSGVVRRKKCRGTQTTTIVPTPDNQRQRSLASHSIDFDGDDSFDTFGRGSPRKPPKWKGSQNLKRKGRGPHSPSPFSSHSNLKKGASASALLDSDSDESGYGDTFQDTTIMASSFDTLNSRDNLFAAGNDTTLPYNDVSESESSVTYITGTFPPINPEDMRDSSAQTPGHAHTQTPRNLWDSGIAQTSQSQLEMLPNGVQSPNQSLHSVGSQTKQRANSSKANLLRSIIGEVKTLKHERGIDTPSHQTGSSLSVNSTTSIQNRHLEHLLSEVQTLRNSERIDNAATQTLSEQGVQTPHRLFSDGDPVQQARHERLGEMIDSVRHMKGDRSRTTSQPSQYFESRPASTIEVPFHNQNMSAINRALRSPTSRMSRIESANSPINSNSPMPNGPIYPQENGVDRFTPMRVPQNSHSPSIAPPRRRVTQEDLNNISERIERLRHNQMPPRRIIPTVPVQNGYAEFAQQPPLPPPLPAQVIPPPPSAYPPPHYRVREFRRSYDDMDVNYLSDEGDYGRRRRSQHRGSRRRNRQSTVMDRLNLDDALYEAEKQSRQLKKMSKKMKTILRDEMGNF